MKLKTVLFFVLLFALNSELFAQNNCLDFRPATSGLVNCGTILNGATTFTVECWIKPESNYGINTIVSTKSSGCGTGGFAFHVNSYNTENHALVIESDACGVLRTADNTIEMGKWQHVALVISSSTSAKLFINGVEQATTGSFQISSLAAPLVIGDYTSGTMTHFYFKGAIDEMRVWNVARPQNQIQSTIYQQLVGTEDNLLAYYPMNQGVSCADNTSITSLSDLTTNIHHGTLTGFTLLDCTSNFISADWGFPTVTTGTATNVTDKTANINGEVINQGLATVSERGVCYSTNHNPTTADSKTIAGSGLGIFSASLTNLTATTTYYARAYAINSSGTSYGTEISFTTFRTSPENALYFDGVNDHVNSTSGTAPNLTQTTIEFWLFWERSGTQTDFIFSKGIECLEIHTGGANSNGLRFIPATGVYVDAATNSIPSNSWIHVACVYDPSNSLAKIFVNGVEVAVTISGSGSLNTPIDNSNEFIIGSRTDLPVSFCFLGKLDEFRIWNVARTQSEIQSTMNQPLAGSESGLLVYYNLNDGTACGDNRDISGCPTIIDHSGHGNTACAGYFGMRAGDCTSNYVVSGAFGFPVLSTDAVTNISLNSATMGGNVTLQGSSSVTERGVCFNTAGNPTIADTKMVSGSGIGSFSGTQSGLISSTNYVARAYATNSVGTNYGQPIAFRTRSQFSGNALNFDGVDDYVHFANTNALNMNNIITIEFWMNWQPIGTNLNTVLSMGTSNTELKLNPNDYSLKFDFTSLSYEKSISTLPNSIPTNQWVHIAIEYQTSNVAKVFVNGTEVQTIYKGMPDSEFSIGYNSYRIGNDWLGNYFKGELDELRIWKTIRTQSEIQNNMFQVISNITSDLRAYFDFDNGVACADNSGVTTLLDVTQLANPQGVLNNFALNTCASNWVTGACSTPAIITQPQSTTLNADLSYTMSVTANSPTTLSYQWKKNGTDILGETQSTLVFSELNRSDAGDYTCLVSNTCGSTLSKMATVKVNAINHALDFDGTKDFVSIFNTGSFEIERVTLECWLKWEGTGDNIDFVCGKDIAQFEIHTGGSAGANGLRFIPTPNVYIDAADVLIPNQWQYIACVYNPETSTGKIYVNGVEKTVTVTGNLTNAITPSITDFYLGKRSDNSYPFQGEIDNFAIWNTERTQSEIQNDQFTLYRGAIDGLVAFYDFDKGVACSNNSTKTTLPDRSSNANQGTLSGFDLNNCASNWVESGAGYSPINITTHPQTQAVDEWGTLSLTCEATGNYLAYQWKFNGNNISGATSNILTINKLRKFQDGNYSCVVSNQVYQQTSNTAAITVNAHANNAIAVPQNSGYTKILVPSSASLTTTSNFTAECWFYVASDHSGFGQIMSKFLGSNTTFNLMTFSSSDKNLDIYVNNKNFRTPSNSITYGRWNHFAGVFDDAANTFKIYINGGLVQTVTVTEAPTNVADGIQIGGTSPLKVDEIRFWNTARTAQQIADFKNAELTGNETGLVTYYSFNQGIANGSNSTENILYDLTANNNNGTLYNYALSGTSGNWVSGKDFSGDPIYIYEHPLSQTKDIRGNVTFTVGSTGTLPITYQWKKEGVNIDGETGNTYIINSLQYSDAGNYTCQVTNTFGSQTTNTATLTVICPKPAFTTQPSSVAASIGQSITLTAVATSFETPTYQWKKDNVTISGATQNTYNIPSFQTTDAGNYTCEATNECGTQISDIASVSTPLSLPFSGDLTSCQKPAGWSEFNDNTTTRWTINNDNKAGGEACELMCKWEDVIGTSRFMSSAFVTSGYTSVILRFKHYFDDYRSGCTIKVQQSNDRTNWTDVWTYASGGGDLTETKELAITVNPADSYIYFAFTVTGDLYQFDYWYIDNIEVFIPAISGNVGVSGATLNYTDGTAKTSTADESGNYSFNVNYNWSGIVTPTKTGITFNPASRNYSNLTVNQTSQDYTPVADYTWTGAIDNQWNNPGNWNPSFVPAAGDDVLIPDKTNDPFINEVVATPAVCKDLIIQHGAVMTISAGKALTVNGTLTNSAGITGLVIQSDITGSGSLINGTSGVLATVERWMTGDLWHLISPAATGGETVASFVGEPSTQNDNLIARNLTNFGLAPYDESKDEWDYYTVNNLNTGVNFGIPGTGYQVLRATGAGTGKGNVNDNGKVSFIGTLGATDVNIGITKTVNHFGWNLVGNPYPCALDVKLFLENAGNITAINQSYRAIYVADITNTSTYGYSPINYATEPELTFKLASGEGFFVKSVADDGTINFTKEMKSHTSDAFKSAIIQNGFNLVAESAGIKMSTSVKYIPQMTAGLDPGWDAGLFTNGDETSFSLFTALVEDNGVDFTIQCLPDYDYENLVVPVGITAQKGATVTFSLADVTVPVGYKVFIEDRVNHKFTRLDEPGSIYTVQINADSNGTGRFFLHTKQEITGIKDALTNPILVIPVPQHHLIRVSGLVNLPAQATVYDINGRTITIKTLTSVNENDIQLNGVSNGIYLLKIKSGTGTTQHKISWTL